MNGSSKVVTLQNKTVERYRWSTRYINAKQIWYEGQENKQLGIQINVSSGITNMQDDVGEGILIEGGIAVVVALTKDVTVDGARGGINDLHEDKSTRPSTVSFGSLNLERRVNTHRK